MKIYNYIFILLLNTFVCDISIFAQNLTTKENNKISNPTTTTLKDSNDDVTTDVKPNTDPTTTKTKNSLSEELLDHSWDGDDENKPDNKLGTKLDNKVNKKLDNKLDNRLNNKLDGATKKGISGRIEKVDLGGEVQGEELDKDIEKEENAGNVVDNQTDNLPMIKLSQAAAITAGICLLLLLLNFIQLVLVIRIFGTRKKEETTEIHPDVPEIVITKDGPSLQTFLELENQNEASQETKTNQSESSPNEDKEISNMDNDDNEGEDKNGTAINKTTETKQLSDTKGVEVKQVTGMKLTDIGPVNGCPDTLASTTTIVDLDDFPPPPDVTDSSLADERAETGHETSITETKVPSEIIASLEDEVKKMVDFTDSETFTTI